MPIKLQYYRDLGAQIGENVRAFSPISSGEPYLISVGSETTISTGVKFCTHDNAIIKAHNDVTDLVGPISIGCNCFVGMNTILLPGVFLGDSTIVGAGSVVTKSFPNGNVVIGGNPARMICTASEYFKKSGKAFDFKSDNAERKKIKYRVIANYF